MTELLQYFESRRAAMLDLLTAMVERESFTGDKRQVDQLIGFMAAQLHALAASSVQRYPQPTVGDFLLAKWNEQALGKPYLFLAHVDTVHPIRLARNDADED